MELKNKRVLVLGLGDTGLSALRWLSAQGAVLTAADSREAPPNMALLQVDMPQVPVHLGPFQAQAFADVDLIVISPGIALSEPLVQAAIARGVPVVGDVELFALHRPKKAKIIAITGSNGKSTVTSMVGAMCKKAGLKTIVAGNIGVPVLDTLAMETPDVYVLELSSFQLETTSSLNANAATVLNVSEDHLDRYPGITEYAAAKARIFAGSGVQVLNRRNSWSRQMALASRHIIYFGDDAPDAAYSFGLRQTGRDIWLMQGDTDLLNFAECRVAGLHNATNALAALALCRAIGLSDAPLLAALREFKGLPHRVEWVTEINGITFFDDSKGTNVGATCAALAGLPPKVVLIAGGDGKGQNFSPLQQHIQRNARGVVLIGRDAPIIAAAIKAANVPLMGADTMQDAVNKAFIAAQPGDAVLLSPACASFDMFRNYIHRAEVFVSAVHHLEAST